MSALILYPLAAMILRGVQAAQGEGVGFISGVLDVLTSPRVVRAIYNSAIIATATAFCSTIGGVTLGWLVGRTDLPGRRFFAAANIMPFFMSPFVGALGWVLLAAPNSGIINQLFRPWLGGPLVNIYSMGGMIWVFTLFYLPYVYLFTIGSFSRMNPELEEAARTHGASLWPVMRHVTLPLATPAIISGFLMAFVSSIGILDVPLVLGVPAQINTLPTQLYDVMQFPADYKAASAIGIFQLFIAAVGVAFLGWSERRRSFVTVTGKSFRPRRVSLGRGGKVLALALEVVYLSMAIVLPVAALLMASLQKFWMGVFNPQLFTWSNYHFIIFEYPLFKRSLFNSLFLTLVGSVLALVISLFLAYYVHRLPTGRLGRTLEMIVTAPIGFPGITLGLGILIGWVATPIAGTIWILVMAYILRFMPYPMRICTNALLGMHRELEESARTSGAGFLRSMVEVVVPLIKPSLLAAALLVGIIFMRELSVSALLWSAHNEVMSIALLIASQEQLMNRVAAFAVLQIAVMSVFVVALLRFVGTDSISDVT